MAMPARQLALSIFCALCRFRVFATKLRKFSNTSSMDPKEALSVTNVTLGLKNDSKAWVKASAPVSAAMRLGMPARTSASKKATLEKICGLLKNILYFFSSSTITAALDTSLPVPAVVGIVINGKGVRGYASRGPWNSLRSNSLVARIETAFAASMELPPAPNRQARRGFHSRLF